MSVKITIKKKSKKTITCESNNHNLYTESNIIFSLSLNVTPLLTTECICMRFLSLGKSFAVAHENELRIKNLSTT
jgi:hypothetical protein